MQVRVTTPLLLIVCLQLLVSKDPATVFTEHTKFVFSALYVTALFAIVVIVLQLCSITPPTIGVIIIFDAVVSMTSFGSFKKFRPRTPHSVPSIFTAPSAEAATSGKAKNNNNNTINFFISISKPKVVVNLLST